MTRHLPATRMRHYLVGLGGALLLASPLAQAADPEVELLKEQIRILQKRVEDLEKARAKPPSPPSPPVAAAEPKKEVVGEPSAVADRGSMQDQQQAAPRPGALTLDPKYRGFINIPHTPVLIKFNAKPRVDMAIDNRNSGDDNRFVTAKIPVQGDSARGGGPVFNINAKGSQLRIDARAPEIPGSPRFYYENDFYGSGGGEFPYRVRHLYGQFYNVIVGQTFSVFEDPDVWPDTVDYEGPPSAIFARRPLIRYQHAFNGNWQANVSVEQPDTEVDASRRPSTSAVNHGPDGGFNVRWEDKDIGHVQFASIFRYLGIRDSDLGDQETFGWGTNLAGVFNTWGRDSVQGQLTYGEGIFRYVNDDFFNNDAAFDSDGDLEAIPYFGGLFGYTHHWTDEFRSTASYGYTHIDNASSQFGSAYHVAHYGSGNLIWQLRKRLSVGAEVLYGAKESKDGSDGDAVRFTIALMYSIFD